MNTLRKYLPDNAAEYCYHLLTRDPVKLKVTKGRLSKLGDYRYNKRSGQHLITVNGDLNPYSFLITLVHEIAHLRAFVDFGFKIKPHGKEWKSTYTELIKPLLNNQVFPEDLLSAVRFYFKNPKASSCSDPQLVRALRKYDHNSNSGKYLSEYSPGNLFVFRNKEYKVLSINRTRSLCKNLSNGKNYLISHSAEVDV